MDIIEWEGAHPVCPGPADEARTLASLHALLRAHLETIAKCEPREAPIELRQAAGRLVEAYLLAAPIWHLCRAPLGHRLNSAPELHEIFARVDAAELDFASQLARARRAWLFRALRHADVEGE